jgi:hypothetical protein
VGADRGDSRTEPMGGLRCMTRSPTFDCGDLPAISGDLEPAISMQSNS